RPIMRESCATVISVGEGMIASTSHEVMDAMFQPRPHEAIAIGPPTCKSTSAGAMSTLGPGCTQLLELARIAGGLGQEPIAKGHDFRQGSRSPGTDDPIGLGETHLLGKRAQ